MPSRSALKTISPFIKPTTHQDPPLPSPHPTHKNLAKPGCVVVPAAATVYVQPVACDAVRQWTNLRSCAMDPAADGQPPCPGPAHGAEVHVDELRAVLQPLAPAAAALEFDFAAPMGPPFERRTRVRLRASTGGRVDAIVLWWTLHLDADTHLSTAPGGWRDG